MWGCTADVTNAFHSVPLEWSHHRYFAFCIRDQGRVRVFVFQFLPFGLSSAPWAFTRIVRPIKRYIRIHICPFHSYLDDFFILDSSAEALNANVPKIKALITSLGLSWNEAKSDFRPRLLVHFLGVLVNLQDMTLSLPEDKIAKCIDSCIEFRSYPTVTRRQMERLVGFLSFISRYIQRGRLYILPLIARMLRISSGEFRDSPFPQDSQFLDLLSIWEDKVFLSSRVPMHIPDPQLEIMTDASGHGWSGIFLPDTVWGKWEPWQQPMHSNWKELKAIHLTLMHFFPSLINKVVLLFSDNSTALACLRKQGSLHSASLHWLTEDILEFCAQYSITLIPRHLQGALNVLADRGSRKGPISTEWSLDDSSFHFAACRVRIFPQVDLFATRYNYKIDPFVSPCPDVLAWATDATSLDWNHWDSIYLFPPKTLLPSLLSKIASFRGQGLLIAGRFPGTVTTMALESRCSGYLELPSPVLSQETDEGMVTYGPTDRLCLHAWFF